jgi:predicted amidohydrolase
MSVSKVVVGAVQAAPVFLDRDATVEKAARLTKEAAANGAGLVVLPEAFVPTYPDWVWRTTPWADREWYERIYDQSVAVPGPATEALGAAAREASTYLSIFCMRGSDVPRDLPRADQMYGGDHDWMARGNTTICGPEGEILAGPLEEQEGIIYAEIDADHARKARRHFDPVGHYARPDVLRLVVDREAKPPAAFAAATAGPRPQPDAEPDD